MGIKTLKELKRIRMEEDDRYVDVYYANAVDNLFFKMRRSLFISRSQTARTKQILLKNAIVQLEEKRGCKCDNLRLEFHIWGVVKRKCKKYANKLLTKRVNEFYAGLGIVNC